MELKSQESIIQAQKERNSAFHLLAVNENAIHKQTAAHISAVKITIDAVQKKKKNGTKTNSKSYNTNHCQNNVIVLHFVYTEHKTNLIKHTNRQFCAKNSITFTTIYVV